MGCFFFSSEARWRLEYREEREEGAGTRTSTSSGMGTAVLIEDSDDKYAALLPMPTKYSFACCVLRAAGDSLFGGLIALYLSGSGYTRG